MSGTVKQVWFLCPVNSQHNSIGSHLYYSVNPMVTVGCFRSRDTQCVYGSWNVRDPSSKEDGHGKGFLRGR